MVKSEYGKVERAREGRAVVGENRKLAIAVEIGMAGDSRGPPRDDGSYKPYQSTHRRRTLQSVPLPGEADPEILTTRSAPHPVMVTGHREHIHI